MKGEVKIPFVESQIVTIRTRLDGSRFVILDGIEVPMEQIDQQFRDNITLADDPEVDRYFRK